MDQIENEKMTLDITVTHDTFTVISHYYYPME